MIFKHQPIRMTSLVEEKAPQTGLILTDASKEFLNSPYKEVFATEFSVGSNKLQFYGQPLIMSKYCELIKTSLPALARSKPPHELLTMGVVLERPMTLLWLYLNGYEQYIIPDQPLSLTEALHLYRLCNYFGVNLKSGFIISVADFVLQRIAANVINEELDENNRNTLNNILEKHKLLDDFNTISRYGFINLYRNLSSFGVQTDKIPSLIHKILTIAPIFMNDILKNKNDLELVVSMWNQILSDPAEGWKLFLSPEDRKSLENKMNKGYVMNAAVTRIFHIIDRYPEIAKLINYIRVYVDYQDENYVSEGYETTYAERKALGNPKSLGRLNPGWKYNPEHSTETEIQFTKRKDNIELDMVVQQWGPNAVTLEIIRPEVAMSLEDFAAGEPIVNPILV